MFRKLKLERRSRQAGQAPTLIILSTGKLQNPLVRKVYGVLPD